MKILISDHTHPVLEQRLHDAGFTVIVQPDLDRDALIRAAQGCDGLVVRSKVPIDRAFIDRLERAKPTTREALNEAWFGYRNP
ncbi:MAG: hypothetical protein IKN29_05090, partial [Bacteroidales bacterium]|nr:hypothetical protein [Bacteroidales bacterium]